MEYDHVNNVLDYDSLCRSGLGGHYSKLRFIAECIFRLFFSLNIVKIKALEVLFNAVRV